MPTRAKPGCTSHLVPRWLHRPNHTHTTSNMTPSAHHASANATTAPKSTPPLANTTIRLWLTIHENAHKTAWRPTKLPIYPQHQPSTQNKPPMLMESAHENAPTDGMQCWGPLMRTQRHWANQQGIHYPPCSQVCTAHLPLTSPNHSETVPVPSVTRPPLHPTHLWLLRPHVDTQMHQNSADDGEDSWWVHFGVTMLLPLLEFTYNLMYS